MSGNDVNVVNSKVQLGMLYGWSCFVSVADEIAAVSMVTTCRTSNDSYFCYDLIFSPFSQKNLPSRIRFRKLIKRLCLKKVLSVINYVCCLSAKISSLSLLIN